MNPKANIVYVPCKTSRDPNENVPLSGTYLREPLPQPINL